jgi:cytochrome c biogenesis protein CcmG/thiol:disulfide interchange protein DsbE
MQRLKYFLPLFIFVVIAGFLLRGLDLDPAEMPSALLDKPVPDFRLPALLEDSREVSASDLQGEVVLLNVWATWCVSCRVEHPMLNLLKEQGVKIVGLNYKDDPEAAKQWLIDLGNPYAFNVVDKDGRLGLDLGVFGAPETFVIDRQGIIRYKYIGVIDERVWATTLEPVYQQLQ